MSKPIEFVSLFSSQDFPLSVRIGALVGMSVGSAVAAYGEYCYQHNNTRGTFLEKYAKLFALSSVGGSCGLMFGMLGAVFWPIPCAAAITSTAAMVAHKINVN